MAAKKIGLLVVWFHCLLPLPAQAENRAATRFEATGAAGATALLEFAAAPLVAMTVIPFRLDLNNTDGTPLTGASVSCSLTMPSMPMPANRPTVKEREGDKGAYVGEIIFTCTQGAWRFTCEVVQPDGQQQALSFNIPRVRIK